MEDRESVLEQLQGWLEKPMLALSFMWLALLVVELAWGLNRALYLKRNWLKALALVLPALRVFRLARFARAARVARARGSCGSWAPSTAG